MRWFRPREVRRLGHGGRHQRSERRPDVSRRQTRQNQYHGQSSLSRSHRGHGKGACADVLSNCREAYEVRLYGAFLPSSRPKDQDHPSVNFLIWKLHLPSDPNELPPDQKVIFGRDQAVPGYTIVPRKP